MSKLVQPVLTPDESEAVQIVLRAVLGKSVLVEHDADKVRGALEALATAPVLDGRLHVDPAANQMGRFARRSPESRQAALQNFPRSGTQRLRVLAAVSAAVSGLTREEVAIRLRMAPNVATPRVLELIQGGWLVEKRAEESGERITRATRSGAEAVVLVLSEKAKGKLRASALARPRAAR